MDPRRELRPVERMMSPDPPPPDPVPMRMLPDDPVTEAPERMDRDPVDPLIAGPDATSIPPDPVVPVPSGERTTMAAPSSCAAAGWDANPPPQHRRTWFFDKVAHIPYHPQLMDVVTPPRAASEGTLVVPRRDAPQHLTLPWANPQV